MRRRQPPPPWLALLVYLGLFFGGGIVGMAAARMMAPGSGLAELLSFLALPAGFMLGIVGWAGAAIPAALGRLLRHARERGSERQAAGPGDAVPIPPGGFAFVPAALAFCVPAGVLVGVISDERGFLTVLGFYTAVGLAFGVLCWRLARSGYLQFPNE